MVCCYAVWCPTLWTLRGSWPDKTTEPPKMNVNISLWRSRDRSHRTASQHTRRRRSRVPTLSFLLLSFSPLVLCMASFRFTSETPDARLFTDIQALNAFTDEQMGQFVDTIIVFLTDKSSADLQESVESFAEEHKVNLRALKNCLRGVLAFFRGAVRNSLTPTHVKEDLSNLGLEEEKAGLVAEKWKAAFAALSRTMITQTLMVNQLVDMEWTFGVTTGNSDVDRVGSSFLRLKLVLDKGNTRENVFMELTVPQFYEFLSEMERAKAALDLLS